MGRFPALLPVEGGQAPSPAEAKRTLEASRSLSGEIDHFLTDLLERNIGGQALESAMTLQNRNMLLSGLCDTLETFLTALETLVAPERYGLSGPAATSPDEEAKRAGLADTLIEVAHLMLVTVHDLMADGDPMDRSLLHSMTSDHSETMEGIRRTLLRQEEAMEQSERETLFEATRTFEQLVWLIRRYSASVSPEEVSAHA
ncbi:hypothetical protein [Fodinicurvata halophila]|uniref:hypothetical protein n=1 Tax=Fodinicurvata halophila TaxID=1419723 RepID=UPI00363EBD7A